MPEKGIGPRTRVRSCRERERVLVRDALPSVLGRKRVAHAVGEEQRVGRVSLDSDDADAPDGRTTVLEADDASWIDGVHDLAAETLQRSIERRDRAIVHQTGLAGELEGRRHAHRTIGIASHLRLVALAKRSHRALPKSRVS